MSRLKLETELVEALRRLKDRPEEEENFEFALDEIEAALDEFCKDDFTRGYLTCWAQTKANAIWGSELVEEIYFFAEEMCRRRSKPGN